MLGKFTRKTLCGGSHSRAMAETKMLYFSDDEAAMEHHQEPVRRVRRHPDRSGRRRSANADILESVGLPSTVSYQDMKTLQDGLCTDDILGRRSRCSNCLKGAAGILGGNVTRMAKRTSSSLSTAACWAAKMTPPAVIKKLQKKHHEQAMRCSMADGESGYNTLSQEDQDEANNHRRHPSPFFSSVTRRNLAT